MREVEGVLEEQRGRGEEREKILRQRES